MKLLRQGHFSEKLFNKIVILHGTSISEAAELTFVFADGVKYYEAKDFLRNFIYFKDDYALHFNVHPNWQAKFYIKFPTEMIFLNNDEDYRNRTLKTYGSTLHNVHKVLSDTRHLYLIDEIKDSVLCLMLMSELKNYKV
ncbi:MAG: hypothetical protein QXN55_01095 [Candidatus Nitrosotenuis sp.]